MKGKNENNSLLRYNKKLKKKKNKIKDKNNDRNWNTARLITVQVDCK